MDLMGSIAGGVRPPTLHLLVFQGSGAVLPVPHSMAAHWLRIDSSDVPGAVRGLGTGLAEPSPSWGFYSRAGAGDRACITKRLLSISSGL